jgi:maltooligosyltrehalose trehalohydrolase
MEGINFSQGAQATPQGVRYRVWSPRAKQVVACVWSAGGDQATPPREVALRLETDGFHAGLDSSGRAGDRYMFRLDGDGPFPCPAARFQPGAVSGPAEVIDPGTYRWSDQAWRRPPFRDLVIYELHVGTFTPEGTYRGVIDKLGYLRELGVNAIELMPLADFPGRWNWGYDGVRLFAPASVYGRPDDLRALVDAAHAHGLAVILDVVYNHFGPDGNYLRQFSPAYFESRHHTPWGEAINFSSSEATRQYYRENILYWMEDFHIDGFRLDATHAIFDDSPRHIFTELTPMVHDRGGYIIAEDERNEAKVISPSDEGGYGFDAVWADDFHHSVEVALIDASIYAKVFQGELRELVNAMQNGWVHPAPWPPGGVRLNTACAHLPPERFVFCISNHDQAGNRAFGERLNHFVSPETYRAASALLCLIPYTPLLFMGQEWGASTPFQFFTDHNEELGRLVEKGRRSEMKRFPVFEKALVMHDLPSPQDAKTFERSKLDWSESERDGHGACLRLYREALRLRREYAAFRPTDRSEMQVSELRCGVLAIRVRAAEDDWLILCDLRGGHQGNLHDDPIGHLDSPRRWHVRLSSNDPKFGGPDSVSFDPLSGKLVFQMPEVLVLRAE